MPNNLQCITRFEKNTFCEKSFQLRGQTSPSSGEQLHVMHVKNEPRCMSKRNPEDKIKVRPEKRLQWSWVRGNCHLPTQFSCARKIQIIFRVGWSRTKGVIFRIFRVTLPPAPQWPWPTMNIVPKVLEGCSPPWTPSVSAGKISDINSDTLPTASGRESRGVMEDCQENQVFRLTRSVAASHSLQLLLFLRIVSFKAGKLNIIAQIRVNFLNAILLFSWMVGMRKDGTFPLTHDTQPSLPAAKGQPA